MVSERQTAYTKRARASLVYVTAMQSFCAMCGRSWVMSQRMSPSSYEITLQGVPSAVSVVFAHFEAQAFKSRPLRWH